MTRATVLLALMLVGLTPGAHAAEPAPDQMAINNGHSLALKLCINCHQVEPGAKSALSDVPSFMTIAKRKNLSAQVIKGFILEPHPAMPEVQLTTDELHDITAYILSLKTEQPAQ